MDTDAQQRGFRGRRGLAVLAGLLGATGMTGCYERVIGARGVASSGYKIEESNLDRPAVVSDFQPKDEPVQAPEGKRYRRVGPDY